jgi:U3 small nucleolar RNA-associated protein 14
LYLLYFQIVKKPGVIIKPIQYEEVDPHMKPDEPKRVIQRVTPHPNAKKASTKQSKGTTSHKRK